MLSKQINNDRGLTLIELLAVIVILGIISAIATIAILNVIQKAKDQAIVANSYALRDSATFYVKDKILSEEVVPTQLSYQTLVNEDYIEKIRDPDTNSYLDPAVNTSYVVVSGERITAVCFKGLKRNLCTKNGIETPIPTGELSTKLIQSNN
jgi:general secretion pathway protein G